VLANNGGRRILVVEDDPDLRQALAEILRDEGYSVEGASHGAEALALLRNGSDDSTWLILLDLTMPVMNGWQFRDEQVRDPNLSQIPVVVLSAGERLADQLRPLGIQDFVRKPIELPLLLGKIRQYCS
jgi:CheY-like chemotaxis protein